MRVSGISNMTRSTINPRFKSNITFDIGGSQREGSCKIRYVSTESEEEFYTDRTSVNELGRSKFVDSEEFLELIVNKIKNVQKASKGIVKEKGYDTNENTIKNVAIFLPSYTDRDLVFYFPNLKNKEGKPLENIDFGHFKERLEAAGVQVSEDMQFKVLQDALGTGLAMAQRLYDYGMLKEGSLYSACITGGGCGIANIACIDKDNIIIQSSGSALLPRADEMEKVSGSGASATSLARNFCRSIGLSNEMIDDIVSCNMSEFALSKEHSYPKNVKTEKLRNLLVATDIFEVLHEDDKEFTISCKEEYLRDYDSARRYAITRYCTAIARLASIKRSEGSNGLIVTGTLATAIDKIIKQEYKSSLSEWVYDVVRGSFNSSELSKLQKVYDFKVICDKGFYIDNNAECKGLVHLAQRVPNRSNWLKITAKDLQQVAKQKMVDAGYTTMHAIR